MIGDRTRSAHGSGTPNDRRGMSSHTEISGGKHSAGQGCPDR